MIDFLKYVLRLAQVVVPPKTGPEFFNEIDPLQTFSLLVRMPARMGKADLKLAAATSAGSCEQASESDETQIVLMRDTAAALRHGRVAPAIAIAVRAADENGTERERTIPQRWAGDAWLDGSTVG